MSTRAVVNVTERVSCGPGRPLMWILGPCVIESHDLTLRIADTLAELARAPDAARHLQGFVRQGQSHFGQVVSRSGPGEG